MTGVPKGTGVRMSLDRDRDGFYDGDERDAGSDPGDPLSTPSTVGVPDRDREGGFRLEAVKPNPTRGATEVTFSLGNAGRVDVLVYDVLGRETRAIARGTWFPAGRQSVAWDGRRADGTAAGTGIYFVRVRTERGQWTRPLVMTR